MLYTRLFVRKRSVFSTKVVFYRSSTCTVMIYSHSMQSFTPSFSSSPFHRGTLQSVSVTAYCLKSYSLVFVKGCEDGLPRQWAPEECMKLYAFTARVDLITALSVPLRSSFARLCLPDHSDFHRITEWCRGPRRPPLGMAFPINHTTWPTRHRKGNGKA